MGKYFCLFLIILSYVSHAQKIDSSFGENGRQSLSFDDNTFIKAGLILSKDSLMLLSNASNVTNEGEIDFDVVLTKLDRNGQIDSNFGVNGITRFDFDTMDHSSANEIIRLRDNSYVISGFAHNWDSFEIKKNFITKIKPTGLIDSSFGKNGTLNLNIYGVHDIPECMELTSNDRILLAGSTKNVGDNENEYAFVMCLNTSGQLDSSFGETGIIRIDYSNQFSPIYKTNHFTGCVIYDIVELENGNFLFGGTQNNGTYQTVALFLSDSNGNKVTSALTDGTLFLDPVPGVSSYLSSMELLNESTIVFTINSFLQNDRDFFLGYLDLFNNQVDMTSIDFNGNEDKISTVCYDKKYGLLLGGGSMPDENSSPYISSFFAFSRIRETTNLHSFDNQLYTFQSNKKGAVEQIYVLENNRVLLIGNTEASVGKQKIGILALTIDSLDTGFSNTGTNKSTSEKKKFYPNPIKNNFTVNITEPSTLVIFDAEVRLIWKEKITKPKKIDCSNWSKGIYYISLIEGENNLHFVIIKN